MQAHDVQVLQEIYLLEQELQVRTRGGWVYGSGPKSQDQVSQRREEARNSSQQGRKAGTLGSEVRI
jgi:hypothetical protein